MLNSKASAGLTANNLITTIAPPKAQGKIELATVNIAGLVKALKVKKLCSTELNDGSVFANKEGRLPKTNGGTYHEFRVTDSSANSMRAVVFVPDQPNPAEPAKMFVTGDHYLHFSTYDNNFGQFFPVKDFAATEVGKKAIANPALYRKAVVEQYPALGIEYAAFKDDFAKRFPPIEPAHIDVQSKVDEIKKAYLNKLSDPKSVQQLDLKDVNLRKELALTDKYNDGTFVATEYKISPQRSYRIIGPKDIAENVTPPNTLIFQGNSDGKAPLSWEKIKGVILCRRGIYARLRARQLGAVVCGGTVGPDPKEPNTPKEPLPEKKFKPSVKDSKSVKLGTFCIHLYLSSKTVSILTYSFTRH
ncbi:hypothetical protein BKA69DRAFT_1169873 [Paraphysoderma sedebokerense]|nr:hypothetical protein BKA69DRAFT_1169873 [Paraphysoderma sedebokerense]